MYTVHVGGCSTQTVAYHTLLLISPGLIQFTSSEHHNKSNSRGEGAVIIGTRGGLIFGAGVGATIRFTFFVTLTGKHTYILGGV